ncbi:Phosphatidylinositol 3-kinase regulatory subunit alpha [Scophthalmus maximus]|uniref:Phosphatidylinositol 3-kinase regulatory subunit alpha n=1 Tax=Scophthalmus maximus TaxID=52904 RepID=A0A2U9C412_SCOMX|nr:Phosphatidylinositol 3-kinase regulatory subunit alpha [Scophthalmus maximus]
MASDSVQYRAIFEYKRERGDDISLQPGDLLTVLKGAESQEGAERSPRGWLHGTNERTKEKGDFPGTFVEYVGALRVVGPPAAKSWPRPVPPTPGGQQTGVGPPPPGAAAASGESLLGKITCSFRKSLLQNKLKLGFDDLQASWWWCPRYNRDL